MMIWFYGDPHGDFATLKEYLRVATIKNMKPDMVVILGDMECRQPFWNVIDFLNAPGIRFRFVHGNHDYDHPAYADNIREYPNDKFDLSKSHSTCGSVVLAGIGGDFNEMIWRPKHTYDSDKAAFYDYERYCKYVNAVHQTLEPADRDFMMMESERKGRAFIYPADIDCLIARGPADILVSHPEPQVHGGSIAVEAAAQGLGVRLIVHGHTHKDLEGSYKGVPVIGVGKRGLVGFDGTKIYRYHKGVSGSVA